MATGTARSRRRGRRRPAARGGWRGGGGGGGAARAAQAGGAAWLAVATAGEAAALREAGICGPLLVMGALTAAELTVAVEAGADVVAWREDFVRRLPDGV